MARGNESYDKIMFANQLASRWEDYPGLSGGPKVIIRVPASGRERQRGALERWQEKDTLLEEWQAKKHRCPPEAGHGKDTDSFLVALPTPSFPNPVRPISGF